MYSPKAFKQGTKARYYLQSMMSDKATEDRQVVETNLKMGKILIKQQPHLLVMNTLNTGIKKQKRNYKHMKINRRLSL